MSREEVARKFFAPPPEKHLQRLQNQGIITSEQAALALRIPMAQDLTAEADSGGHTDNRPALCLFPTMLALRDEMARQYDYTIPLRVGLAGGIATPQSAAAAFAMGAAYILTGSVNQSCQEADTSPLVKKMLAKRQTGGHHHGPGGRHVRDGREGAGAQTRHHVFHAWGAPL